MESDYRCYFCFARAFEKMIINLNLSVQEKKELTGEMFTLFNNGSKSSFSVPALSRELYHLYNEKSGVKDPYREVKKQSNDQVLGLYDHFREHLRKTLLKQPCVSLLPDDSQE